jgi:hypothetical protein
MAYLVICEEIFLFAKLNIGFDLREDRVTLDFCDTEEGFLVFKTPCSLHKGQNQQLQEEVLSCDPSLFWDPSLPFPTTTVPPTFSFLFET